MAVECGSCIAANGNIGISMCLTAQGLSNRMVIIISVVCAVVVAIVIAVIVVVVKLRKQTDARHKLIRNLQDQGVDSRIINNVANLNYSKIDSSIFRDVDVHMALQQASKRVQNIPPPNNVAVTRTASETEGLFGV
jgi:uncharacterized membrane protein YraQ (UPF0718 family)